MLEEEKLQVIQMSFGSSPLQAGDEQGSHNMKSLMFVDVM